MRHKHADVIHAWAEDTNQAVQWKKRETDPWIDWEPPSNSAPTFSPDFYWRIKPKIVKKEGWVNIYSSSSMTAVYPSEEEANVGANRSVHKRITCIHIEWEEEE